MQICFLVRLGHLGFSADLVYFAFFDGNAAVDDLAFKVGFSVCEDRINNHFTSRYPNSALPS
jgi:hypothetical protein